MNSHRRTTSDNWRIRVMLVIALVIGGIIGGITYARAAVTHVVTGSEIITSLLPLKHPADPSKPSPSQPVVRIRASFTAGLAYGLSGTLRTRAQYLGSLQAQVLYCYAPGVAGRYSVWSTTNHLGPENGAAPDKIVQTSGQWIFTAPATAEYTCTLYGRAGRNPYPTNHPLEYLTVTSATISADLTARPFAAEWRQPTVEKVGGENGTTKWILIRKWTSPISGSVRVRTETQLSSISIGQSTAAIVDVSTYVTQLTSDNKKCSRYVQVTRPSIPGKLHHLKIGQTLIVPYNPECSNTFAVQVQLAYVSGQGMQAEGSTYSSAHAHPMG